MSINARDRIGTHPFLLNVINLKRTSTLKQPSTMDADGINEHAPPVKEEMRSENTSDCRNIHISPARFEICLVNTTSYRKSSLRWTTFPKWLGK